MLTSFGFQYLLNFSLFKQKSQHKSMLLTRLVNGEDVIDDKPKGQQEKEHPQGTHMRKWYYDKHSIVISLCDSYTN